MTMLAEAFRSDSRSHARGDAVPLRRAFVSTCTDGNTNTGHWALFLWKFPRLSTDGGSREGTAVVIGDDAPAPNPMGPGETAGATGGATGLTSSPNTTRPSGAGNSTGGGNASLGQQLGTTPAPTDIFNDELQATIMASIAEGAATRARLAERDVASETTLQRDRKSVV